jgi:hypothetical protein
MDLVSMALQNGASMEVLERLFALQERNEANAARRAFDGAVSAAKAEIPVIIKDRQVDFANKGGGRTTYKHEDMASIAKVIDPILGRHGLSYRFRTPPTGQANWITVTIVLAHRDGHSEENSMSGPSDTSGNKNPLQAIESTVTYLQRYLLKAALGIAAGHDDDGRQGAANDRLGDISGMTDARPAQTRPAPQREPANRSEAEDVITRRMDQDEIAEATLNAYVSKWSRGDCAAWTDLDDDHLIILAGDKLWNAFLKTLPQTA